MTKKVCNYSFSLQTILAFLSLRLLICMYIVRQILSHATVSENVQKHRQTTEDGCFTEPKQLAMSSVSNPAQIRLQESVVRHVNNHRSDVFCLQSASGPHPLYFPNGLCFRQKFVEIGFRSGTNFNVMSAHRKGRLQRAPPDPHVIVLSRVS